MGYHLAHWRHTSCRGWSWTPGVGWLSSLYFLLFTFQFPLHVGGDQLPLSHFHSSVLIILCRQELPVVQELDEIWDINRSMMQHTLMKCLLFIPLLLLNKVSALTFAWGLALIGPHVPRLTKRGTSDWCWLHKWEGDASNHIQVS